MKARTRSIVHRFVTRPLQLAVPPLGDRLHDLTSPTRCHPTVTGVRFAAMYELDPTGGWQVRRRAVSTERLTETTSSANGHLRASASAPVFASFPGEGVRRSVVSPKGGA